MKKNCRKTKIIATIGPASNSQKSIEQLKLEGVDIFRLNFSHGTQQEHGKTVSKIRAIDKKLEKNTAILADLQGPKIRTSFTNKDSEVTLYKDRKIEISSGKGICTEERIYISYNNLYEDVKIGAKIMINDGAIKLEVIDKKPSNKCLLCQIMNTGVFSSHKGVNFPDSNLKIGSLTEKDRNDLNFILTQDIDIIALSFVRSATDILSLNKIIQKAGKKIITIAKIEKPEALEHLQEILDSCDGIMVARGDLGVETSLSRVPILQKEFINLANKNGKIVIVATQMLESMIEHPVPTRAEASDVANAVFDGTDAVMLSGETATGKYPINTIKTMSSILTAAENSKFYLKDFVDLSLRKKYPPDSLCEAAEWAARDLGNVPVVVFTMSGQTAFYMSKLRNQSRIFAFSPDYRVVNMLSIAWNTTAFHLPVVEKINQMHLIAESLLLKKGLINKGEYLLFLSGKTFETGTTNILRVKKVGYE